MIFFQVVSFQTKRPHNNAARGRVRSKEPVFNFLAGPGQCTRNASHLTLSAPPLSCCLRGCGRFYGFGGGFWEVLWVVGGGFFLVGSCVLSVLGGDPHT